MKAFPSLFPPRRLLPVLLLAVTNWLVQLSAATIQVDLAASALRFQTAWGANIGPVPAGPAGNPSVTAGYRDIGVKFIRTHDYYGPLDMKALYPNQGADPALPSSYNFTASDGVWRAVVTNGFWP